MALPGHTAAASRIQRSPLAGLNRILYPMLVGSKGAASQLQYRISLRRPCGRNRNFQSAG